MGYKNVAIGHFAGVMGKGTCGLLRAVLFDKGTMLVVGYGGRCGASSQG